MKPRRAFPIGVAAATLASAALASGCAQFLAGGEQARQGWREGRVVQIGAAASIDRNATLDCRRSASESEIRATYAVYQYRSAGGRFNVIAPLPNASTLKVGDTVRINTQSCALTPTPR